MAVSTGDTGGPWAFKEITSVGGQETGTVRLDFAIFLAQSELDSEPVDLWGSNQRSR